MAKIRRFSILFGGAWARPKALKRGKGKMSVKPSVEEEFILPKEADFTDPSFQKRLERKIEIAFLKLRVQHESMLKAIRENPEL